MSDEPVDVAVAMQRLAGLVISETEKMLYESSPAIREKLLTSMFGKMLPLLSTDQSAGTDDLRQAMTDLFQAVRADVVGGPHVQAETEVDEPEPDLP